MAPEESPPTVPPRTGADELSAALEGWREGVGTSRDTIESIRQGLAAFRRDVLFDPDSATKLQEYLGSVEQRFHDEAETLERRQAVASAALDTILRGLSAAAARVREEQARLSGGPTAIFDHHLETIRSELGSAVAGLREAFQASVRELDERFSRTLERQTELEESLSTALAERREDVTGSLATMMASLEAATRRADASVLERVDDMGEQLSAALHTEAQGSEQRIAAAVEWKFRERVAAIEQGLLARLGTLEQRLGDRDGALGDRVAMEIAQRVDAALRDWSKDFEARVREAAREVTASLDERLSSVMASAAEQRSILGEVVNRAGVIERALETLISVANERDREAAEGLRTFKSTFELTTDGLEGRMAAVGQQVDAVRRDVTSEIGQTLAAVQHGMTEAVEQVRQDQRDASSSLDERLSSVMASAAEQRSILGDVVNRAGVIERALETLISGANERDRDAAEGLRTFKSTFERTTDGLEQRMAAVLEQVVELARAEVRQLGAITARWDEGVESMGERVETVKADLRSALRDDASRVDAVEQELGELRQHWERGIEALLDRLGSSEKAVAAAISALQRDLPARVTEGVETLRRELPAVGQQVDAVRRDVTTEVGEKLAAVERGMTEAVERIRQDQQVASSTVTRTGDQVRTGMERMVESFRADLEALRSDLERQAAELGEGMARIDRVGDAVSTIGRRRGFRKLADAERQLHEQEASLVQRIHSELASLPGSVEAQLKEALEIARTDIEASIAARLEQHYSENGELASLRAEVEALRQAVDAANRANGGGSSRQIRAMERRLKELQQSVEGPLAGEVAARVRASIDRRLKKLFEAGREAK